MRISGTLQCSQFLYPWGFAQGRPRLKHQNLLWRGKKWNLGPIMPFAFSFDLRCFQSFCLIEHIVRTIHFCVRIPHEKKSSAAVFNIFNYTACLESFEDWTDWIFVCLTHLPGSSAWMDAPRRLTKPCSAHIAPSVWLV